MSHEDRPGTDATLVAIAKNERRYVVEWVAFHLAIGFSRIVVYDNDSDDGTFELLQAIARVDDRIATLRWPSRGFHASPQVSAYNDAVQRVATPWIMCLDLDEFLVPFRDLGLAAFLSRVPDDAASVHVNWLNFGSGGRESDDYDLVTEAFTRGAPPHWGNHHHFKTIARADLVREASIHDLATHAGRRVLSDMADFATVRGVSDRIVHDGIQINHYQCKTLVEFQRRMRRGDANYHPDHHLRGRDDSAERFRQLDVNEREDVAIGVLSAVHRAVYDDLVARLASEP